jgi:subtilase family serine protease
VDRGPGKQEEKMENLLKGRSLSVGMAVIGLAPLLCAQPVGRPVSIIREPIDESRRVTLYGNTRPEAIPANDRGRVPDDFPMEHLLLQLRRSPEREAALEHYIDQLHDRTSPYFHQWLTAQSFAEHYGMADADVATVRNWLQSQGFTIHGALPTGLVIDFSGTAGLVTKAFHTEIHTLSVNGETHYANMSDPQIPAALAPAVTGIMSLHNFRPKPLAIPVTLPVTSYTPPSSGLRLLAAGDLETIYNINPLYAAGFSGQGQKIMVLEDTYVYSVGDFNTFRKVFGLARAYPDGNMTQESPSGALTCTNPGVNGDDAEAEIDVEWASAAAPNASIVLAACADTFTFGGLIAVENVLNGPAAGLPNVISMSYGESETRSGAALISAFTSAWQQATTMGISVFVSSGDSAAALSDRGTFLTCGPGDAYFCNPAEHGINGVNGWGASQFDTLVGGTDFGVYAEGLNVNNYWNTTNSPSYESAKSYIPEIPWNDSCASALIAGVFSEAPLTFCNSNTAIEDGFVNVIGGSGGPSACATGSPSVAGVVSGTCAGYGKPAYQTGLLGNPSDGVRDSPDVALFAANGVWGSYYVVCYSDPSFGGVPCSGQPDTWAGFGGTSVSSPIMAGIQALINQKTAAQWGNANVEYYAIAKTSALYLSGACNSNTVNPSVNTCAFYDVTVGDNNVPCYVNPNGIVYNCYQGGNVFGVLSTSNISDNPAYKTNAGWDFATGIGSVNAFNLAAAFP